MFKSYYHKNISKISSSISALKYCYVVLLCYLCLVLNNNYVEKNINIRQALFFSLLKIAKAKEKINNISYIIIVLIKIRIFVFLVFIQYILPCKYRIVFQISIFNWMQNCIFYYLV